jgi:hypothetical protein
MVLKETAIYNNELFTLGDRVGLNTDKHHGIQTGTIVGITVVAPLVFVTLKNLSAKNGCHMEAKYKNVSLYETNIDQITMVKKGALSTEENFFIWY